MNVMDSSFPESRESLALKFSKSRNFSYIEWSLSVLFSSWFATYIIFPFSTYKGLALLLSVIYLCLARRQKLNQPVSLNLLSQTEETKSADVNGPRGIISAIGISVIVGWGYIIGITFAVTDISYLLSSTNDAGGYAIAEVFYQAFKSRYGSGVGGIICLGVVAVAIFFCGMGSVTSNSR